MLVCQRLFNCLMKQKQKFFFYANKMLICSFCEGGGSSVQRLAQSCCFIFFYHGHGRHGCLSFLLSHSNKSVLCFMMEIFYWLYVLLMVGWASGLLWRMWRGRGLVTVWHLHTVFSLALSGSPTWWTSSGKMELSCLCKFFFTLKRNPVSVIEPKNFY